jgi:hypothetical protein
MPVRTVCYGVLRILSVLLLLPRSGQAQEGGTFCVGPSYLADELVVQETYDSAHGVTPARHSLYLVWPDSTGFMGRRRLAPLPIFVVHGMQCLAEQVRLLGWDSLYAVPVTASRIGALSSEAAPWAGQGPRALACPTFPTPRCGTAEIPKPPTRSGCPSRRARPLGPSLSLPTIPPLGGVSIKSRRGSCASQRPSGPAPPPFSINRSGTGSAANGRCLTTA